MKPLCALLLSLLAGVVWLGGVPPPVHAADKEPTFEGKPVSAWVNALKAKDPKARAHAAYALGVIGPAATAAVPALSDALKDRDEDVRHWAAEALGRIGAVAVPVLIDALKDNDKSLRLEAATALGNIGPEARSTAPALADVLKDQDKKVGVRAAEALGKIGPGAGSAGPALIDALKDKDKDMRQCAATVPPLADRRRAAGRPRHRRGRR
jgi:HEAT repeat protein